jgi:hypothetical protein
LKLKCDELLSNVAFDFHSRRYIKVLAEKKKLGPLIDIAKAKGGQ